MSDDEQRKQRTEADSALEQEIRKDRKFSLEEAMMRLAGPGMMKGESPVTRQEQAEAKIEGFLRSQLIDAAGTVPLVLLRHVSNSELLIENLDEPLVVLATYVGRVLNSDYLLAELVREADAEWGRMLGERPFFEKEGVAPHPDDPYTVASLRITLSQLMEKLTTGDT